MCVCLPQSSVYSLALKSVISLSTLILLGLIVAYHCCEVQVTTSVHNYIMCWVFFTPKILLWWYSLNLKDSSENLKN